MNSSVVLILVLSIIGAVFAGDSFPFGINQPPNYDHIPQCLQPPAQGMCLAYFLSYYYNASAETCQEFVYGGCQGNKNRFVTFDDCMKTCEGTKITTEKFVLKQESDVVEQKQGDKSSDKVCSLPKDAGICYALLERFYFNGKECESFEYGGCMGNANNFDSLEACNKACSKAADQPKSEENKSQA